MRRIPSDKYNIAWFKLAECVSRGEQERAFGVYRLLSHSIDDHALVQQLAGDLFLAFHDEQMALDKYERAADLYQRDERVQSAVAVYNHMLTIDSSLLVHRPYLARLYERLGTMQKKGQIPSEGSPQRDAGFTAMLSEWDWSAAVEQIERTSPEERVGRYRSLIVAMLSHDKTPFDQARPHVRGVLDLLLAAGSTKELKQFFAELKAIDTESYDYAREYAKQDAPGTKKKEKK